MENNYEVADRVKVTIEKEIVDPVTQQKVVWKNNYAGTIVTYHLFKHPKTEEEFYLYKVSVDGIGDIVICREQEDGSLEVVPNTFE